MAPQCRVSRADTLQEGLLRGYHWQRRPAGAGRTLSGPSSNGRTADFGSVNPGSNPGGPIPTCDQPSRFSSTPTASAEHRQDPGA